MTLWHLHAKLRCTKVAKAHAAAHVNKGCVSATTNGRHLRYLETGECAKAACRLGIEPRCV